MLCEQMLELRKFGPAGLEKIARIWQLVTESPDVNIVFRAWDANQRNQLNHITT